MGFENNECELIHINLRDDLSWDNTRDRRLLNTEGLRDLALRGGPCSELKAKIQVRYPRVASGHATCQGLRV